MLQDQGSIKIGSSEPLLQPSNRSSFVARWSQRDETRLPAGVGRGLVGVTRFYNRKAVAGKQ